MTASSDPEDAYAYYGEAIVYQNIALQNEDTDLLEAAGENYLRVLEIDPDHKGSKKELKRLQKMMEKMGIRQQPNDESRSYNFF